MDHGTREAAPRHDRVKRPYQPPVVEETAVFETLALCCGKSGPECEEDPFCPQLRSS